MPALKFLESWLLKEPQDLDVLQVLILTRRGGVEVDKIVEILVNVESKSPNRFIYSALIDLYFEKFDQKKVLSYCKKLFDLTTDSELKSKILFQTAYVHYVAGNQEKVEKILQTALKYEPVYPSTYNLLAYLYAQNNKKLPEALEKIELALKVRPDCYYYMDTKGYVLLKMGKSAEAKVLFEQASKLNPDDQEVLKHLKLAQE